MLRYARNRSDARCPAPPFDARPGERRVAIAILLLLVIGFPISGDAMDNAILGPYRWDHRLLLVFSPSPVDERLRRIESLVARDSCALQERDLLVGWLPESGPNRLGERPLEGDRGARLRAAFGIDAGTFAVLLIGKDGGEKYRADEMADFDRLYALIDSMPMRRAEMAADPSHCSDAAE